MSIWVIYAEKGLKWAPILGQDRGNVKFRVPLSLMVPGFEDSTTPPLSSLYVVPVFS